MSGKNWLGTGIDLAVARIATQHPLYAIPAAMASPPTQTLGSTPSPFYTIDAATAASFVTFKGGNCSLYTRPSNGSIGWRNYFSYTNNVSPAAYYIEFDFYGPDLSFRIRDNGGSDTSQSWLWIDGVPATADFIHMGMTNLNVNNWYVDFGTAGRHRIRMFFHNCDFAGFNVTRTTLIEPTENTEPSLAIYGDSWVQGANGVILPRTFLYTAALLMGMQPFAAGQGGTGYLTPDPETNVYTYLNTNRVNAVAAVQTLDYLIVEGSINDDVNNDPTPSQIQAAATSLYATFARMLPDTKLIVMGVQSTGTGATGDTVPARVANNDAVIAAAELSANVVGIINPIADHWIVGDGYVGNETGNGPSDWAMASQFHPSQDGSDFLLAPRSASAILDILAAQTT